MSDRGDECMNKRDMKFKAESIVRQLFRDNGISERFGVTECVSGIIDSFRQDNNLGNSGTQENKTVRKINKFLEHRGLRIVRIEDIRNADAIDMDEEAVRDAVNILAESLRIESEENMKTAESFKKEIMFLREELESSRAEAGQLRLELKGQRESAARHAQSMLSISGREGGALMDMLASMLDELGMNAVWHDKEDYPEATMFTVLKSPNPETRRNKPCIVSGSQVIAKGLVFVDNEGR